MRTVLIGVIFAFLPLPALAQSSQIHIGAYSPASANTLGGYDTAPVALAVGFGAHSGNEGLIRAAGTAEMAYLPSDSHAAQASIKMGAEWGALNAPVRIRTLVGGSAFAAPNVNDPFVGVGHLGLQLPSSFGIVEPYAEVMFNREDDIWPVGGVRILLSAPSYRE